jgi:hypothetical protein
MKLFRIVVPVVLALAAGVSFADGSGSGSGGSGSGSGGTVSDADVKRWLAFFDKLVDVVVNDKDSCPKMGSDLNSHIDANQDLLAAAQKARAEGKQLPPDAVKHMTGSFQKMGPAMMACKDDASVKSAIQRLKLPQNH